jgi:carbon monoxide dehydrogenase subunit G
VIFTERLSIEAEASRVWDFLLDVNSLATCLPGVQEMNQVDDRTFDGVISASVGPIAGTFSYRAQIVESTPPVEMLAKLQGTDSVTSSTINADVRMSLDAVAAQHTELAYHATVTINGRLAILGDMVLRTTATLMLDEFARRLRRQLENPTTESHAGPL